MRTESFTFSSAAFACPKRVLIEIRARHVVEQHFVLDRKQFAAALRQMRLKCGLLHEKMVEPAIEPIPC